MIEEEDEDEEEEDDDEDDDGLTSFELDEEAMKLIFFSIKGCFAKYVIGSHSIYEKIETNFLTRKRGLGCKIKDLGSCLGTFYTIGGTNPFTWLGPRYRLQYTYLYQWIKL